MAAEFVQPFRKSRACKNDRNDAEAIAIAVRDANMRFVAVKSVEQQARLARHRVQQWSVQLHARVGYQKTLVAIANKNARVIWALLARKEDYNPQAWKAYAPSNG